MSDSSEPSRPPSTVAGVLSSAVDALRPFGPTPIVSVVLGGTGMVALSAGAPAWAVVALAVISFGTYLYGQERKARWLREELKARYDGIERHETRDARLSLERRIQLPGNQGQPNLGGNQEVGR